MIARILNTALEPKLIETWSELEIIPLVGYSDSKSPFIIYREYPTTQSEEVYFLQKSRISYTIYDRDISRAMDVYNEILGYLNVGNEIATILSDITYTTPPFRIHTVVAVGGDQVPPLVREGFSAVSIDVSVTYNLI